MKNVDMKIQKKLNEMMSGNFPQLMNKILLINPPSIIKVLLKLAKVFMKKKLMERV
jgi:hypothetical protein